MNIFEKGDFVINDFFKTSKGLPYIIEIKEIDSNNIVRYFYKGENYYISSIFLRKATRWDKFIGYLYDKLFK